MEKFWSYIYSDRKWHAWLMIDNRVAYKLGPFDFNLLAEKAVEAYENSDK